MKTVELAADPAWLRTVTVPVVAPAGTVKVTAVGVTEVGTTTTCPISTPTVPVRFVPVIVTVVPTCPLPGESPVTAGGGRMLSGAALVADPAALVMRMSPVVAPVGTMNVSLLSEGALKAALVPLTVTVVVAARFVPETVTVARTPTLPGENPATVGGATTMKELALLALPEGVVTTIGPDVAPTGTVKPRDVSDWTVKGALTPFTVKDVAPLKAAPLTRTEAPTTPRAGVKPPIVGAVICWVRIVEV